MTNEGPGGGSLTGVLGPAGARFVVTAVVHLAMRGPASQGYNCPGE